MSPSFIGFFKAVLPCKQWNPTATSPTPLHALESFASYAMSEGVMYFGRASPAFPNRE